MTFRTKLRYRFGDIDDAGIAYYPKLLHGATPGRGGRRRR
jgi:acyl-CoA thioesterase FadM